MGQVKTTIEVITPQMAEEYLKHNDTNRKLNKGVVDHYARMMREGEWMLNGESIVFDNKGNLLDGQHRLNAIIAANVIIQSVVVRNVDCDSFTTIDTGKTRSAGDTFSIKGIQNGVKISTSIRKYIVMCRINMGSLRSLDLSSCESCINTRVSTQEILDEYNSRPEFWQEENLFANRCCCRCRLMSIGNVVAISAYLQLNKGYKADVVHNFFTQLFYEEHTENNTLALFRRQVINDAMVVKGVRMTPMYKTQLLIKCWEAFKKNKEYKSLRWSKEVDGEYRFE